jgi:hypothetical protein
MYTAAENAEMLILYEEWGRNAREDAREYAIRFSQRLPYPNYNVFLRLVNRARDTRSFVVPREKLERQKLKMLFFSPLMTGLYE